MLSKLSVKKDITTRAFFIAAVIFVAVKLVLASQQMVYINPDGAPIDDTLMFNAAVSITNGEWLGGYNWLTLSKYPFFPIYLALQSTLHIPYLLGNQLLQLASCAFAVYAFAPVIKNKILRLALFAALLYNPAVNSAAVQLRVYRDSISAQLALLFFAGFVGFALRYKQSAVHTLPFLVIGGIGLAASYLNREDGVWLLPFAICATITVCIYLIIEKNYAKCALQIIPYAILCAAILAVCAMNSVYYGRFIISDYTSAEFKDACGALMRVSAETESVEKTPVTLAARRVIAENIPEFADVEARLESIDQINGMGDAETLEYAAGGFFWALRQSVYESGYADTALEAEQYYKNLAEKINALCDSGVIAGGKRQSGTMMPFKASYIAPVAGEALSNMLRALTFDEAQPYYADDLSIATPDILAQYQAFLRSDINYSAVPNTSTPYYTPAQHAAYAVMRVIKYVLIIFMCVGFIVAFIWQIKAVHSMIKRKNTDDLLLWIIELGLLLCALLRCGIIAYMFVTSFNEGVPHIMYLSAVHPILLLFAAVGTAKMAQAHER